ncbi:hypothetical protein F2Q69_00029039 [Brassica cretica]|uniref:Uncharacterized protein n=1 Tax=Brassica cretica TaxID=69181 RepID=A0A8S9RWZ6_BRACR|nr:hypothetical protein F2Q69_00029039 [Brassica cretica]
MSSSQSDKKGSASEAEVTGLRTSSSTLLLLMWRQLALSVSFLLGINWLAVMPKRMRLC